MNSKLSSEYKGEVLFQNGIWSIERAFVPATGKHSLVAVKMAFYTYWVIVDDDKNVWIDNAERVPKTIIKKIERFAKTFSKE